AIWIDGKRAHQRVRSGETINMPSRRVWLEAVHVNAYRPPMVQLQVRCGSGTYLRALGMDLAGQLGTTAVMTSLTRTHVGPFDLNSAMEPETFVTHKPTPNDPEPCLPSNLHRQLINPAFALHHMARLHCDHAQAKQLRNGLLIDGSIEKAEKPLIKASKQSSQDAIAIDEQGQLIAIVRQKNERWAPHRVFMA
ncbi:MAG: tRNA pseudouridine(55) synthase TruB, partial [Planctomycetota bacterium]